MRIFSTKQASDWFAGVLNNTWLNYSVYASTVTGYPALVPIGSGTLTGTVRPAYTLISGGYATPNGGHAWTVHNRFLTTDQANDTLTISPASATIYVDIVTTGALYPDMVDTMGNAWPYASDGQAAQTTTTGPLAPNQIRDGTGMHVSVDGTQVAQIDTSLGLQLTRINLDGLSSHTVVITNTGNTVIPTTDVHRFTLVGLVTTAGSGGGGSPVWTSPILDALDPNTTWIGADWEQAAVGTVNQMTLFVGQTPTVDGTWHAYTSPIVETSPSPNGPVPFTQEGVNHGRSSFLFNASGQIIRGRYAQLRMTLNGALATPLPNGSTVTWVRSLDLYSSVPETETLTMLRLPPCVRGKKVIGVQSAYGAVLAKLHADTQELIGSYSIGGSRGRWLQLYGKDLGIPAAPGEGQAAYAAQLQSDLAGKALGPSAQFIAGQVSAYIGATATVTVYGASGTPWHYTLTIPTSWPNPVTTAQITTFATSINIGGNILTVAFL